jgi:hypothetical protein
MSPTGQPDASEYAPEFERYVALVRGGEILEVLDRQAGRFRGALEHLSDSEAGFRYAEGKWSVREVLGHVVDAERVFGYRALCFARGEQKPLPGFDEEEYARNAAHGLVPLPGLLDEFESVRRGHLLFLRHLDPPAWRREGVANSKRATVRALAFMIAGHADHHLRILRDRYRIPVAG